MKICSITGIGGAGGTIPLDIPAIGGGGGGGGADPITNIHILKSCDWLF